MAFSHTGNGPFLTGDAPLGWQGSSVYSLTFEEFQNALGEPGKILGSMNMDELLKNIWTAEESQAMAAAMGSLEGAQAGLASQRSLQKDGSMSLPRTLSTKTVEEVWKSLQQEGQMANVAGTTARQATLGEMTLEDFLVRAGVVRDEVVPANQAYISFGGSPGFSGVSGGPKSVDTARRFSLPSAGRVADPAGSDLSLRTMNVASRPSSVLQGQFDAEQTFTSSMQDGNGWMNTQYKNGMSDSQQHGQQPFPGYSHMDAASAYVNIPKSTSNGPFIQGRLPPTGGGLEAVLANGGQGINTMAGSAFNGFSYGVNPPLSPASDGAGSSPTLAMASPYGMSGQGRKRCAEGPVEKVIERRQRRMIKNRESAARSRARKQAYTVELEAEVSQLKEENLKLLRKQEEEAERRKRQIMAVMPSLIEKEGGKWPPLRRTCTGPW